jgi:hypothetical protein
MANPHLLYLKYLLRHKLYFYQAGRRWGLPLWACLTHDWDKFKPSLFHAYALYHFGDWSREKFEPYMDRHVCAQPHHWEHYFYPHRRDYLWDTEPIEIPDRYILEMILDWEAAGRAKKSSIYDPTRPSLESRAWYERQKEKLILHPLTRKKVEYFLRLAQTMEPPDDH